MKKLMFATGTEAKLAQLRYLCDVLNYDVEIHAGRERFGDLATYEELGTSTEAIARRDAFIY